MLPMNPFSTPRPQIKSVLQFPTVSEETPQSPNIVNQFIDQRLAGFRGKSRSVTLPNTSSLGGSAIAKNQDNTRCVIAGKDSLRIVRVVEPSERHVISSEHRAATGRGGYRIEASRNQWTGSGLKIDSALTDVVWCHKPYDTKILTSARNGELIVWDVHRLGSMKFERKTKCHMRSINKLAYHPAMVPFCCSASSDGNLRLWDLRDLSKASYYINHPFPIRTAICLWDALNVVTGLDNGSMSRWDLRMGQKGLVERVPLAHSGHILSFDFLSEGENGWLASAGQDRTVKVWQCRNDTSDSSHSTRKPTYVLHASYPIRRVIWRPGYETELAIASTAESSVGVSSKLPSTLSDGFGGPGDKSQTNTSGATSAEFDGNKERQTKPGDKIEIWDVRRPWIAKWTVDDSDCEGGVSDMTFVDSHALWVQHASGAFSQTDLRYSSRPIDAVTRSALSWSPSGSLAFVSDNPDRWEKPYDDRQYNVPRTPDTEANESQKKLGDCAVQLTSQNFGLIEDAHEDDWDSFEFQARNYRINGESRSTLCEENSQVAYAAKSHAFGNIWVLLQSLLQELDMPPQPIPNMPEDSTLLRSISTPSTVPTMKKSPLRDSPSRSSSSDPPNSANYATFRQNNISTSVHTSSPLSPRHPYASSKAARLGMENKAAVPNVTLAGAKPQRRNASRSTSFSAGKSSSTSSRRNREIGEGALADSEDDTDPDSAQTLLTPSKDVFGTRENGPITSVRPLRLVNNPNGPEDVDDWAEDEKEDSTSPASSSDVDSSGSVASTRAARSSSNRRRTKSRGSQLSSHDVQETDEDINITRTNSRSSVLTITAGVDQPTASDLPTKPSPTPLAPSTRSKSQNTQRTTRIVSSYDSPGQEAKPDIDYEEDTSFLEWNQSTIKQREEEYKQSNWDALKILFEEMSEQGELQMCAMLACIVPTELGLEPWRVTQFIEAYIDLLSRQRLHSVAAYLRKYAPISDIRQTTRIQTTMYSNCANCRKPILQPVNGTRWMGYNYCIDCKRAVINCAICHLPVRSAAFVCAVCTHGGHRDCYHRYYMRRPMDELAMSSLETRGRQNTRTPTLSSSETTDSSVKSEDRMHMLDKSVIRISGHPCATGCGHYCWASSQTLVSG